MLQRVVTHVEFDWWREPGGYAVQVKYRWIESTASYGTTDERIDRYEKLTRDEAEDVLEAVMTGAAPGEEYVLQRPLFDLD